MPSVFRLAGQLAGGKAGVIGYGFQRAVDVPRNVWRVRGSKLRVTEAGIGFDVASPWGSARLESPQLGRFNAANLLGCLAALLASDVAAGGRG